MCPVADFLSPLLCSAIVRGMGRGRGRHFKRRPARTASDLHFCLCWKEPELNSLLEEVENPYPRSQAFNGIGTVLPLGLSPQCAHDLTLAGKPRKISELHSVMSVTAIAAPTLAGLCHSPRSWQ